MRLLAGSLLLPLSSLIPATAWVAIRCPTQSVVGGLLQQRGSFARSVATHSFTSALRADNDRSSEETFRAAASVALCTLLLTCSGAAVPCPSFAYGQTDYASETVQAAVKSVNDAVGNTDAVVKSFKNIAEIITEGKGVGGEINFQGVQLDRGYVSDEDTTIYNPGLTLLTESEKDRLVEAIVQSKKTSTEWNDDTEAGYAFLRNRLDPLHMYELRGYLSVLPFYGAALYMTALAVQQLASDLFPVAYILCALAVVAPVIVLVVLGP